MHRSRWTHSPVSQDGSLLVSSSEALEQLRAFLEAAPPRGELRGFQRGALQSNPAMFGAILDHVPQIVWIAREAGSLDSCNRQWAEYTGLGQAALSSADAWLGSVHPEDRAMCLSQWQEAAANKTPYHAEFRLRRNDGAFRWHIAKATQLHDVLNGVTWWIGSFTDNHEAREMQERDRQVASTLQQAFLPAPLPTLEGVALDGYYSPASEDFLVGGDWYNSFVLPDGRIAFVIGDVEGHGMGAAVAMAEIRLSFMVTALQEPYDPVAIVQRANCVLNLRSHSNVTVVFGIFDPATRMFSYAVAGHPRPIIVSAAGIPQYLEDGGVPLGVVETLDLPLHEIRIAAGSMLVFYTDGLIDFDRNIAANEARLLSAAKVVHESKVDWPAFALREIMIGDHALPDDVAILTARFP